MNLIPNLNLRLNRVKDSSIAPFIKMGSNIPKIVHQTFPTKNLPPELLTNLDYMKNTNPDWEFRLYDDKDIEAFIKTEYPALLRYYQKINPSYGAAKADFFRYLLLYKVGGVYLDIKSSVSKKLDEITISERKYILAHWSNDYGRHTSIPNPSGEFQQWHIVAVAGHPFLKAVIENVCQNIKTYNPIFHESGYYGVLKLTGPIAYTLAIESLREKHPHVVGLDVDFGLVYSIYNNGLKNGGHTKLFKKHYIQLKEPIIKQPFFINWLFPWFNDFRDNLKARIFIR